MAKKIIPEQVETFGGYEFEGTLDRLLKRVTYWITEYGPTACVDYSRTGFDAHSDSPGFQILVDREETEPEYQKRSQDERYIVAAREERDRKEYERLSKLFKDKE